MRPPIVYARDLAGRWHLAIATYPGSADTMCDKSAVRCSFFSTAPSEHDLRPEFCAGCADVRTNQLRASLEDS